MISQSLPYQRIIYPTDSLSNCFQSFRTTEMDFVLQDQGLTQFGRQRTHRLLFSVRPGTSKLLQARVNEKWPSRMNAEICAVDLSVRVSTQFCPSFRNGNFPTPCSIASAAFPIDCYVGRTSSRPRMFVDLWVSC